MVGAEGEETVAELLVGYQIRGYRREGEQWVAQGRWRGGWRYTAFRDLVEDAGTW